MHGLCRLGPGRVPGAWRAPCVPNNRVARCVLCIVVVCAVCRGVWQSSPVMACAEMMGCRQARCSLSALYAISSASSVGVSHLHRQHRQHCETLQLTATTLLLLVASRDAVPVGPGTVGSPGDLLVGVKPRHRWCLPPILLVSWAVATCRLVHRDRADDAGARYRADPVVLTHRITTLPMVLSPFLAPWWDLGVETSPADASKHCGRGNAPRLERQAQGEPRSRRKRVP